MDPSRSFIGGHGLLCNDKKIEGVFVDGISDMSDSEDISSNEDGKFLPWLLRFSILYSKLGLEENMPLKRKIHCISLFL